MAIQWRYKEIHRMHTINNRKNKIEIKEIMIFSDKMEQILKKLEQMENIFNNKLDLLNTRITNIEQILERTEIRKESKSHKVTKYGITDITTDTHHIEIKRWNDFKHGLGQIQSYNYNDDKELIVAFFGEYKKNKNDIIELFHSKNIEVWDLIDTVNDITINKYPINNIKSDFYKWCDENIEYSQNSILKLSDVCELFLGEIVGSRIMTQYKIDIKQKFPLIDNTYKKQFWFDNQKHAGWLHLSLKNIQSDFYKWFTKFYINII